jgi:hypothetical protein
MFANLQILESHVGQEAAGATEGGGGRKTEEFQVPTSSCRFSFWYCL